MKNRSIDWRLQSKMKEWTIKRLKKEKRRTKSVEWWRDWFIQVELNSIFVGFKKHIFWKFENLMLLRDNVMETSEMVRRQLWQNSNENSCIVCHSWRFINQLNHVANYLHINKMHTRTTCSENGARRQWKKWENLTVSSLFVRTTCAVELIYRSTPVVTEPENVRRNSVDSCRHIC